MGGKKMEITGSKEADFIVREETAPLPAQCWSLTLSADYPRIPPQTSFRNSIICFLISSGSFTHR